MSIHEVMPRLSDVNPNDIESIDILEDLPQLLSMFDFSVPTV
jgi:hypothetical protein